MDRPHPLLTGGCLCGALRFAVRGPALRTSHCHCTLCRRASGALVVTFTAVNRADFRWTRGSPAGYRSSSFAQREFCATCGSQIAIRDDEPCETLDLNTGCLDHPEVHPAARHFWTDTRVPWLRVDPHLPGGTDPAGPRRE